ITGREPAEHQRSPVRMSGRADPELWFLSRVGGLVVQFDEQWIIITIRGTGINPRLLLISAHFFAMGKRLLYISTNGITDHRCQYRDERTDGWFLPPR
ncbi:MAG: hypothetical protein NHG36_04015, partial [Chromatiaceae bacterium]|nr:hypothetical protein [Candidatus Thioaporhodococcus sediminis]